MSSEEVSFLVHGEDVSSLVWIQKYWENGWSGNTGILLQEQQCCVSGNKEREATSSLTLTRRKDTFIVVLLDSREKKSGIKGYTSKLNPRDVCRIEQEINRNLRQILIWIQLKRQRIISQDICYWSNNEIMTPTSEPTDRLLLMMMMMVNIIGRRVDYKLSLLSVFDSVKKSKEEKDDLVVLLVDHQQLTVSSFSFCIKRHLTIIMIGSNFEQRIERLVDRGNKVRS